MTHSNLFLISSKNGKFKAFLAYINISYSVYKNFTKENVYFNKIYLVRKNKRKFQGARFLSKICGIKLSLSKIAESKINGVESANICLQLLTVQIMFNSEALFA